MKPDMMKVTRCIWFVFLSGLSSVLLAQGNMVEDLSTLQARYLENLYYGSTGADRNFINGSVYQEHMRARGHPFFQEGNWMTGRLVMNGRSYDQLPLKYDIYTDQLLYNHIPESGTCPLVLNKSRIDSFTLGGHTFRHLRDITADDVQMDAGYYQVITEGRASFYIKWEKRYHEPTVHSQGEFTLHADRYILNHGNFFRINRRWGLLKALADRKKEIRTYIRKNNLVVAPGHEETVKAVVDHYNSLQ